MSSASPVARTQSQVIPSRRVVVNNASQIPQDYSTTPGGTMYSTTPGGTRIIYERSVLMQLRNSPMSKTPPKNMQFIPGVSPTKSSLATENNNVESRLSPSRGSIESKEKPAINADEQFPMDL